MHRHDGVTPVVASGAVTAGPASRLEPDAIGVVQDTVIGMASSAPAATAWRSPFFHLTREATGRAGNAAGET
jgi:hypothetical protein